MEVYVVYTTEFCDYWETNIAGVYSTLEKAEKRFDQMLGVLMDCYQVEDYSQLEVWTKEKASYHGDDTNFSVYIEKREIDEGV